MVCHNILKGLEVTLPCFSSVSLTFLNCKVVDQDEPEHEGQHGEPSGGPLQWQGDEPQAPRYGLEDQHSQVIPLIIEKIKTLTHRVMKKHLTFLG